MRDETESLTAHSLAPWKKGLANGDEIRPAAIRWGTLNPSMFHVRSGTRLTDRSARLVASDPGSRSPEGRTAPGRSVLRAHTSRSIRTQVSTYVPAFFIASAGNEQGIVEEARGKIEEAKGERLDWPSVL